MRNLAGLVDLAFGHAQELSTVCTDLERSPCLRSHGFYAVQIADAAVSALAHIAAATVELNGTYRERQQAKGSIRGARDSLSRLKELVRVVKAQQYLEARAAEQLLDRIDEAQALLMAVSVEMGKSIAA